MKSAGIDIGFSGAAALFGHPTGGSSNFPRVLDVFDFTTVGEGGSKRIDILAYQSWLQDWKPDRAYIENANAMPAPPDKSGKRASMGAATSARYMRCAGHIEATTVCCGVESTLVMPGVWKRFFGLIGPKKDQSISMVIDLCPEARKWLPTKIRNGVETDVQKFHNRAEAILISVYAAVRMDMIDLKPAG